jgi:predicted Rdx family selenoprotein
MYQTAYRLFQVAAQHVFHPYRYPCQDAWLVKNAGVSRDLPEIFPEKRRYVAIGPLTGYIFFLKG